MPDRISMHLSVGLRFMLYTSPRADTIVNAYSDFCDRLRWTYQFAKQKYLNVVEDQEEPYDPDYRVPHERVAADPQDNYFEFGLSKGQTYINEYCTTVIPKIKAMPHKAELAWFTEVEAYLKANNYIVSPTDKNLGTCVITRQWFIDNSRLLLADQNNYLEISSIERNVILQSQYDTAIRISTFVKDLMNNDLLLVPEGALGAIPAPEVNPDCRCGDDAGFRIK